MTPPSSTREGNEAGVLDGLAERCEQATGPDWCLDHDITATLNPELQGKWALAANSGMEETHNPYPLPRYTASLDAAMTLVPEGAWWSVMRTPCADGYDAEVGSDDHRHAATPALALCAAALRARAQTQSDEGMQ